MPVNSSNSDIFKNFNLPPQEAINFLKNKAPEISYDWYDVYREAHVKAFTVAGLAKLDVLQDVQNALIEAQEKGQSLETFKQNFLSLLKKKGWYGKQTVKRPDGSVKEVNVSSPWRVKTIYRTNMATAAMAGMYKQLKTMADIMPYWRYVTVGDGRVREEHARIHGRILRHDDPFWDKYFPLNGYNCRCRVEALSEEEMKKKGLKVSDGRSMGYEVMPFVGTGWDYNPGKEDFRIAEEKYSKELKPIIRRIKEDARKAGSAVVGEEKHTIPDANSNITFEEERAIREYISSWSYRINEKLRDGLDISSEDQVLMNNFDSILAKLPRFKGSVRRELRLNKQNLNEFLNEHKVGNKVKYKAYTSTTILDEYLEKPNVILTIKNSSQGADLRKYNFAEQEILYDRNSNFIVKSKKQEDGVWIIELEEINESNLL